MMEIEEPVNDLEAQVQQLQDQVRYMQSEMHSRIMNAYQVVAALLEMLVMDQTMVPAEEVAAVSQQLHIMSLTHHLTLKDNETPLRVRLQTMLQALHHLLCPGNKDSWQLTITGEELWLTHQQASALGMILREWHGLFSERQGVPFSLEIAVGTEQVVIAAFALAPCAAFEYPQSHCRQVTKCFSNSLQAESMYGKGASGEVWAALSMRRDLFETPESQREVEVPRKAAPLFPVPANSPPIET